MYPEEPTFEAPTEAPTEPPTEAPTEPPATTPEETTTEEYIDPTQASSNWVWPVPSIHNITQGYSGSGGHKGIDIADGMGTSAGATIVAASSGTVVVASYSNSAGYWIVIYHGEDDSGNDLYTCYMHCSSLWVSSGEWVSAGEGIGTVGNTGSSFGAHLHFELRLNGIGTSAPVTSPLNYVYP